MNHSIFFRVPLIVLFVMIYAGCGPNSKDIDLASFERERIIALAEKYLKEEPVTVTAAQSERSAGGLHDFYSEGDYWWPDPDNPDGPYIRRDGETNPENFTAHRKAMMDMSLWVAALVAAYQVTGDEIYAAHALRHLKAWFVNPATLMNPNLMYGQAIMGRVTGRSIGIIDTLHLSEVARAIQVLEKLGYLKGSDITGIKQWFGQYMEWMTTHEYGIKERDHGNNHSTCWAVQVGAFASLLGDEEQLDFCREMYKNTLLPDMMAADGSFPKELARTKPYGYSLFHLEAMAMLVQILSTAEDNLWDFELASGQSIGKGIAYLYPYIADKTSWPLDPDIMYHDEWPVRHPFLLFGGLALDKPEYIDLWKTLDPDPTVQEVIRNFPFRQPVLWLEE